MKQRFHAGFVLLAAFFALGSMAACIDDDDDVTGIDDDEVVQPFSITVAVTSANVSAMVGETFTFSNGAAIHPNLAGIQTDFTFTGANSFQIETAGGTASGSVTFGSCILNVASNSIPELDGVNPIVIDPCQFVVTLTQPLTIGETVPGFVTAVFNGIGSAQVSVDISVNAAGQLLVNGVPIGILIVDGGPITGTGGAGG